MRFFIVVLIGICATGYAASPFSMEVKVSKTETLNQVSGVEAQYDKPVDKPEVKAESAVPVIPLAQAGMSRPVEVGQEPAKSVVLSVPMPLTVGGGEDAPTSLVVYRVPDRQPLLKAVEGQKAPKESDPQVAESPEPKKSDVELASGDVLPPLAGGEGPLPKVTSALVSEVVQPPVLISRDGSVLSGEGDMMDYMLSKALPARPVSGKFEDNFLNSLGSPGSSSRAGSESPRSVSVEPVGSMDPGVAFGVPYLGGRGESAISGFEPLPPSGYRGGPSEGERTPETPSLTGQLW